MMHPIIMPVLLLLASALWYMSSTIIKPGRLRTMVMATGNMSFVLGLIMLFFYGISGLLLVASVPLS